MKLVIPSSSVKSKYLKTLPIGTVFQDPTNTFKYKVEEKKVNNTMAKVAVPFLGPEEGIAIQVPTALLKMVNPQRHNIMSGMKEKISSLEAINAQLTSRLKARDKYSQIKDILGDKKHVETDTDIFYLEKGIVFQVPKSKIDDEDDCLECVKVFRDLVWKDSKKLQKVMKRQPRIQSKLLEHLVEL